MSKIIKLVSVKDPFVLKPPEIKKEDNSTNDKIESSLTADLVEAAEKEAEQIIVNAKQIAETIKEQAEKDIEAVKQQAMEDGRRQGHEQGFQEGYQQGQQQALSEMQGKLQEAVEYAERMQKATETEYKQRIIDAERQIVDIALVAIQRILAREIEENPMVVLPIVREALEKVRDQEQIVIRVSADDFEFVMHAKIDLQMMVGRENALTIIADRTLKSGDCIIDTAYGSVDARIDTQFEMVKKAFQGVLP